MKIGRIIKAIIGLDTQSEEPKAVDNSIHNNPSDLNSESEMTQIWPAPEVDLSQYELTLDVLGQLPFRLSYPVRSPLGAHSEKYDKALQIAEEFNQLNEQEGRIAFWDAHYTVFGLASCIVFDTLKNEYWPHHGLIQDHFLSVLGGEEDRYKAFYIYPNHIGELWPFMHWCIQKYEFAGLFGLKREHTYWEEIKRHKFPKEYIGKCLSEAEAYRDRVSEVKDYWGGTTWEISQQLLKTGQFVSSGLLIDEEAIKYYFYYGIKNITTGYSSDFNLYSIFRAIITCPLSTYGKIFWPYYDGYHTVEMIEFFEKQKERSERGEVIKFPAADMDTTADDQTDSANNETKAKETKFVFIAEKRREGIIRQLSFDLKPESIDRLQKLLSLQAPDDKIYTMTNAHVLADFFRQVYKAGDINNNDYNKDQVGDWLAYWFIKESTGKPFSAKSLKDYLQMTDNNPKVSENRMPKKIKYKR